MHKKVDLWYVYNLEKCKMARFCTENKGHICWCVPALQSDFPAASGLMFRNDCPRAMRNSIDFVTVNGIPDPNVTNSVFVRRVLFQNSF